MSAPTHQTFICYAGEDAERALKLRDGLEKHGVATWIALADQRFGEWEAQIEAAIDQSRYFLYCLSEASLSKAERGTGYQQYEFAVARRRAFDRSEQEITIVPVRLENCGRGDQELHSLQQYDLFENWDAEVERLALHLAEMSVEEGAAAEAHANEEGLVDALLSKAIALFYEGDYKGTIALVERAREAAPDHPDIPYTLGIAYFYDTQYGEAVRHLRHALDRQPHHPEILNAMALALLYGGDVEEGRAVLQRLSEDRSGDESYLFPMGLASFLLGQSERAVDELRRAKAEEPDNPVCLNVLGNVLLDTGETEEAVAELRLGRRLDPENLSIAGALSLALVVANQRDEAEREMNVVLASDLDANDAGNHVTRAVVLLQLGRTDESFEFFDRYLKLEPSRFQVLGALAYLRIADRQGIAGAAVGIERLSRAFPELR